MFIAIRLACNNRLALAFTWSESNTTSAGDCKPSKYITPTGVPKHLELIFVAVLCVRVVDVPDKEERDDVVIEVAAVLSVDVIVVSVRPVVSG